MSNRFDPYIPPVGNNLAIQGKFTGPVVITDQPLIGDSNLVVSANAPFDITVSWHVFGNAVPLFLGNLSAVTQDWDVTAYAESEGPGPETMLGKVKVPIDGPPPFPADKTYTATVKVPAGTLPPEAPDGSQSGTYKIIVTAFLGHAATPTGYEIMGYAEGPIIKVV